MNRHRVLLAVGGLVMAGFTACGGARSTTGNVTTPPSSFHETAQDPSGTLETFSQQQINNSGPFFAKLGTNDRTCASCHDAADGWSISPAHLQRRFNDTQGTDPILRALDGANCPSDDVSTLGAATSAYSQLLNHGLNSRGIAGAGECRVQHYLHHKNRRVNARKPRPANRRCIGGRFPPPT